MKYMGSKNKVAKHLLPYVLKGRKDNQLYIEPFCGGCNMIDKVKGRRLANDSNYYVIEMFKALQTGWVPPSEVSIELYNAIRQDKDAFPAALVAFVGFNCSFGAKWFGGYAKNQGGRNYAAEGTRNLLKQLPNIKDVHFSNLSYQEMVIDEPATIYCDPPYLNTVKYKDDFNHEVFWQWVRDMSKVHDVFVSEYQAPDDFKCIKEIVHSTTMNRNKKELRIERLFIYVG